MASVKFLEEALSTDVDESAVNAIVGTLENQLGNSSSSNINMQQNTGLQQNHVNNNNGAISNGGTTTTTAAAVVATAPQKHVAIANGETTTVPQQQQQQIPNGAIGLAPQTVLGTAPSTVHQVQVQQKPQTIVLRTAGTPTGAPGLVTLPVNAVAQSSNGTQSIQTTLGMSTQPIISNLQVLNVRPQIGQAKGQQRVLLSAAAPGLVGARPGTPQLTLQSFHGLQPGQQGALLLKTENGQYQLLRVGPAPQTAQPGGGQPVTFRMQAVPSQVTVNTANPPQSNANTTTASTTQPVIVQQTQPKPAGDNTKEKCRKFLANLLELSNREPKSVERNVRTLIQELIDSKVEPEDFCDKLERLLNASPQPCLIGFLKKSLPLLRHSLATNEMTIDGIKPPPLTATACPMNVVFSVSGATPTVQTVRPVTQVVTPGQVRIVAPAGTTVVRPAGAAGAVLQQRLVTPIRGPTIQQPTRMITTIRQPTTQIQQTISSSQPPALHPVFPASSVPQQTVQTQITTNTNQQPRTAISRPVQMKAAGQSRPTPQRSQGGAGVGGGGTGGSKSGAGMGKGGAGQGGSRPTAKEKGRWFTYYTFNEFQRAALVEKKGFSSAYTGDDDINDVAAMGGVNLAEETQKILGPTEHVGTQIRSCKEDIMCSTAPLQFKIRQIMQKHGLDEPTTGDAAACIAHAAQERIRDLIEKLAVITEHRLEIVKSDSRYEVTNDKKGQLKFLEDLDKTERKKYEEIEREILLRAAKSRSKTEDPEQAKLKAKAKEMQRVEMEELRQREANATALQAIGPRKKPRLDLDSTSSNFQNSTTGPNNALSRGQMPLRQRIKKVTMRDIQFLFESEKDLCKSKLLYKSYLK